MGALWLVSLVTGHTCPWRAATDLSCPLCGGTRATWALATGRLLEAATLNLVAPVAVALALLHGGTWALEAIRGRQLVSPHWWGRAWCWTAAGFVTAWLVKLVVLAVLGMADPTLG